MSATATSLHPLDPLSPDEVVAAAAAVREAHPSGGLRFVSIALREPSKAAVAAWTPGAEVARVAELVLVDAAEQAGYEALVDLGTRAVRLDRLPDGVQPAITPEEYGLVEDATKADPRFRAAMERRGIDLDLVCVDPLPAGAWGDHAYEGRRLCRALAWVRPYPDGNQYARPIEGVIGLVDLHRAEVLEVVDLGVVEVPAGDGEFRAAVRDALRTDLTPIEITQPEGPSFTVDGNLVRWQKWSFRVGFTPREGLVLHTVGYDGEDGAVRPVLHRASFCEMAVPYGDPTMGRYVHSPFDFGENLVGTLANALELGCDCLGLIHYFDATVSDSRGEPVVIRNAVCMHEEDYGLLWKHWDFRTGHTEVRRSRRLVVSSISTIGNYDYGFFWYLYQDGTIEAEIKATGIIATAAVPPGTTPRYGQLVAPGVNGMIHQHFFCARLDVDVDGVANAVYEVHAESSPLDETNPYGNAFYPVKTLLRSEREAPALVDPLNGRYWLVVNNGRTNAVGEPVGYKLMPGENVRALCAPGSVFERRAGFAYRHFWATRFDERERYAAGEYPNQSAGPDGLPRWIEDDEPLVDEDVVVWYAFGLHHLPRTEDWPVMPVHYIGFMLKPFGFFDENPALDVPPPERAPAHCCHHGV